MALLRVKIVFAIPLKLPGICRMKNLARHHFFWPTLCDDIERKVKGFKSFDGAFT